VTKSKRSYELEVKNSQQSVKFYLIIVLYLILMKLKAQVKVKRIKN